MSFKNLEIPGEMDKDVYNELLKEHYQGLIDLWSNDIKRWKYIRDEQNWTLIDKTSMIRVYSLNDAPFIKVTLMVTSSYLLGPREQNICFKKHFLSDDYPDGMITEERDINVWIKNEVQRMKRLIK